MQRFVSLRGWLILLGLACFAGVVLLFFRPARTPAPEAPAEEMVTTTNQPPVPDHVTIAPATAPLRSPAATSLAPKTQAPAAPSQSTPATRQIVDSLVNLETPTGVLSTEQAGLWRTNLAQLIAQGSAAVPAIREFLDKNLDTDFGRAGKPMLGYSSSRLAMIDALTQIEGPESLGALTGVLQTTADPKEIATIARSLEQLDPGTHRQEALEAARQALAMAAEGKLPDRDVAPIFELFQTYGDASVATDLARSSRQWNYYSMFSLAQLPEGAGIPTLAQIANGEGEFGAGARAPALEMLAQLAGSSDVARAALLDQAKANKLSAYNWATLEPILAGDQIRFQDSVFDSGAAAPGTAGMRSTHIASGNQNFYSTPPPSGMSAEQIQQQNALIDELLKVTTDQTGLEALKRAKAVLGQRSAQAPGGT